MFFLLIFLLFYFQAVFSKKINWTFFWCVAFFLVLFAALRPSGMDADYEHYVELYEDPKFFEEGVERIFVFLALLCPDLTILLLIYAILGVTLKLLAIQKMSPYPWFSLLIYFSHYYFLHEVTQIRVGVSCGFILLSLYYVCNEKRIHAWVSMALAIMFHYSALFGCVFLFIDKEKPRFKLYMIMSCISFVKFVSGYSIVQSITSVPIGLVQERLSRYQYTTSLGTYEGINMINVAFWGQIIITLLSFYLLTKIENKYAVLLTKVYSIGLIAYMFLAEIPAMAFRISEICFVVEIILLPMLITIARPIQKGKILLSVYSSMLFVLYQIILKTVKFYPF